MALDIDLLRAQTPGVENVTHLNNAGSALPSSATLNAVIDYLHLEAMTGGYEAANATEHLVDETRAALAEIVNAAPNEIAVTTSDSHSFQKVFWALVRARWFSPGDVVIVDDLSYNSHHMALLQAVEWIGIRLEMRPAGSLADVPDNTKLLALTHVGTHTGTVNDLSSASAVARERGIPFFLDACQSVGQLLVDVQSIGCDVLTGTGRKWLRAPRGTGFLYVRDTWLDRLEPLGIDGHSATWASIDTYRVNADATRFEDFEHSFAGVVGLGSAARQLLDLGVENISARITELSTHLRTALDAVPGVTLHDGAGATCGIVTFGSERVSTDDLVTAIAAASINVSRATPPWLTGVAPSPTTAPMSVVRASPHAYNSVHELDCLVEVVATL